MRAVLEATGDIEVLLDIIAAANSLHARKADKDAQPVSFALSAVLKELIQHSVTLPKWQHGAWTQFSQAMQGDLNIEEILGSLSLRVSGVSPAWNVAIDATDLLAAFVRREPQSAAEFAALLDSLLFICHLVLCEWFVFFLPNVRGEAAARWTLIQLRGFSPSPRPPCSTSSLLFCDTSGNRNDVGRIGGGGGR